LWFFVCEMVYSNYVQVHVEHVPFAHSSPLLHGVVPGHFGAPHVFSVALESAYQHDHGHPMQSMLYVHADPSGTVIRDCESSAVLQLPI
jgi:hypothetical protein